MLIYIRSNISDFTVSKKPVKKPDLKREAENCFGIYQNIILKKYIKETKTLSERIGIKYAWGR